VATRSSAPGSSACDLISNLANVPIRHVLVVVALAVAAVPRAVPLQGAAYYVDCSNGDDASDGLSPARPWKSLTRVSDHRYHPGDSIRFKRGTVCPGMLWPKGSGQDGAPITITAYGTGPLPAIRSGPGHEASFRLFNQEYWRVESIEFVGGQPRGVWISGDTGVLHQIHLKNIVVHHVTGELGDSKESGLILVSPGTATQRFDDVVIDGATAYNTTQWAGIMVGGVSFGYHATRSTNVVVRNSIVHDVQGDGIVLFRVNHGRIENSVAWHTGMQPTKTIGTPNAIWTWMCRDCTVQQNEAFLTDSPGVDGGAFDIDFGNSDNTVQYNYGHDTQGYCVAVFGAGSVTTNSVVRGNVCVNNGLSPRLARQQGALVLYTWDDGRLDGVRVEDNTIVWSPSIEAPAVKNAAQFVGRPGIIRNNVIRTTNPTWISSRTSVELEHNVIEHMGLRESQSSDDVRASAEDNGSSDRWDLVSSLAPSLSEYGGQWLLLSVIDEGEGSHSQVVMLRSAQKQFRAKGLRVVLVGAVTADLAYDWHLEDIPLLPAAPGDIAGELPTTLLISPDRKVERRWKGFVPPGELGMALRRHLGAPNFAQMEPEGRKKEPIR
jgi:Right handed beta helix region